MISTMSDKPSDRRPVFRSVYALNHHELGQVGLRLLHLVLNGQAVSIPPESSFDLFPLHRLIARNDILDDPGHEGPEMRQPSREWGAIIEYVLVTAGAIIYRMLEHVILAPESENLLLEL